MKTALNAPLDDLNMNVGAMKIASAHLAMVSEEYRSYIRQKDRKVILDGSNDALGVQVSNNDLGELMDALKPDEVVLPHAPGSKSATYTLSTDFYNDHLVGEKNKPSVMAVAQGESLDEWMESYMFWLEMDFVDVIGVPHHIDFSVSKSSPDLGTLSQAQRRSYNRRKLVSQLYYSSPSKPIHLMGINNLGEMELLRDGGANKSGFIRSVGTTAPYSAAIDGSDWSLAGPSERHLEEDVGVLDFDHIWNQETKNMAYKNLMSFAEVTGDHSISFNLGRIFAKDSTLHSKDEK